MCCINPSMVANLLPNLVVALVVVLAIVYIINIANTTGLVISLNEKIEAQRPANLELIKLSDQNCPRCFDVSPILTSLKSNSNLKVVKESSVDVNSEEGKKLITELGIENAPTVVVKGEFNKEIVKPLWDSSWSVGKSGVFFIQPLPPYVDLNTKSITGLVDTTILKDSSCEKCFDFSRVTDFFEQSSIILNSKNIVEYQSPEGQELVRKFAINKTPVLIVTKNIQEYPQVAHLWERLPLTEKENQLIIDPLLPPYRDLLASGSIKGLVNAIFLKDETCTDCYDVVEINKQILDGSGVVLASETIVDVSSPAGKELLTKYNITKVPAVLLSPETSEYITLAQAWSQLGTVETDGWFVERNLELLGKSRDLTNTTASK